MHTTPGWPAVLDLIGLGLVVLLLVLGLVRGLWWQVIRLVGVTLAVLAARWLGPPLASATRELWPQLSSRALNGVAWGLMFVLALGLASLFGMLGQRLLEALKLDLANRLAGGLAGAATGLLVHIALVVLLCQLAPEPFLGQHIAGTYSEQLYSVVGVRWPVVLAADAAREIEQALERAPKPGHSDGARVR